jgi:DNA invertase Pin-like site-specific DNA recombinase
LQKSRVRGTGFAPRKHNDTTQAKPAYGYLRTSSAANVGDGKDSERRQQAAITGFAKSAGYRIAGWYRDPAVSGTDPVAERPGYAAMLEALVGDGCAPSSLKALTGSPATSRCSSPVTTICGLGLDLVPASAPDFFLNDTPTAVLVRQVLGAISQFEKATLVAKLKAARDRKRERTGQKVEGRKSHLELHPEVVALAKRLRRKPPGGKRPSLRKISAELASRGFVSASGRPFDAKSVAVMMAQRLGTA